MSNLTLTVYIYIYIYIFFLLIWLCCDFLSQKFACKFSELPASLMAVMLYSILFLFLYFLVWLTCMQVHDDRMC